MGRPSGRGRESESVTEENLVQAPTPHTMSHCLCGGFRVIRRLAAPRGPSRVYTREVPRNCGECRKEVVDVANTAPRRAAGERLNGF